MNYDEAMNLTGSDMAGMFWWVGLLAAGFLIGIFAKWVRPK